MKEYILLAYLGRRLSQMALVLFGSSFLVYNLVAYSGDPTEGLRGNTDPKAVQKLHALVRTLQLDVPPPARFFLWLKHAVLNFDLGRDLNGLTVASEIQGAIPITVRLIALSTILAIIFGITFGIVSALRQYSRFDYGMTFIAFLLFSLPPFWVAVLAKLFLAVDLNNFLGEGVVGIDFIIVASLVSGIFWATVISGTRKRVTQIFFIAGSVTALLLAALGKTHWFTNPVLGPIGVAIFGIGIAFSVTYLSVGLHNRMALKSALSMVGAAVIFYYPTQWVLNHHSSTPVLLGLLAVTLLTAFLTGTFFAKVDRGPIIRTTMVTAFIISIMVVVDRLTQTWVSYVATDAVNGRPIPTISQNNSLLPEGNYWFGTLDTTLHLLLPTLILLLISFAGYTRFSRGTLLEVLNQDYIRTARAKGLTERTVIMRHAFRNTLIPLSTIIVGDLAGIVGGAIITESIFGWRGMGTLVIGAIRSQDINLFMGTFIVTATLILVGYLLVDFIYVALDPRVRVVSK